MIIARLCVLAIVTIHTLFAAAWWYAMPRGFPVGHGKWWVNEAFPWLIALPGIAAIVRLAIARDWRVFFHIALALSAAWCGAAVALAVVFPISGLWKAPFGAVLGLVGIRAAFATDVMKAKLAAAASGLIGFAVGFVAVALQRAADPGTHPTNKSVPSAIVPANPARSNRAIQLADNLALRPGDREVQVRFGDLDVTVAPALQFISRSPDRFWTLLAPRRHRVSRSPQLISADVGEAEAELHYAGDFRSTLRVLSEGAITEIESAAELTQPIYSHLNSYCRVFVSNHRRLFVAFSPCPETRVEVLPSDYPVGRPARAAYLSADGVFRVVEARNAEKGPFRVLAEGPLKRGDPLTLELFDEDRPCCRLTMLDWSAQVDTGLSPTAGWGVPCNAIEFSLGGERPSDAAAFYVTLAGTSLGRGWDSVGHGVGTYWNRMRIEPSVGK